MHSIYGNMFTDHVLNGESVRPLLASPALWPLLSVSAMVNLLFHCFMLILWSQSYLYVMSSAQPARQKESSFGLQSGILANTVHALSLF